MMSGGPLARRPGSGSALEQGDRVERQSEICFFLVCNRIWDILDYFGMIVGMG